MNQRMSRDEAVQHLKNKRNELKESIEWYSNRDCLDCGQKTVLSGLKNNLKDCDIAIHALTQPPEPIFITHHAGRVKKYTQLPSMPEDTQPQLEEIDVKELACMIRDIERECMFPMRLAEVIHQKFGTRKFPRGEIRKAIVGNSDGLISLSMNHTIDRILNALQRLWEENNER